MSYKPSGIREVTCRCGVTFTVELGKVGAPRKLCRNCATHPWQTVRREDRHHTICISVHEEVLEEWHAKVAAMRRAGMQASVSALVRAAIEQYEPPCINKHESRLGENDEGRVAS